MPVRKRSTMSRISSKGNPWHDELGRFTSANGSGKAKPTKWSSFGKQEDVTSMKVEEKRKLDKEKTDKGINSKERYYHKQSIGREKYVEYYNEIKIPGKNKAERKENVIKIVTAKELENRDLANKTGKGTTHTIYIDDDVKKVVICHVPNKKIADKVEENNSRDIRNARSGMKAFYGWTVKVFDTTTRSTATGAKTSEVSQGIRRYMEEHSDFFQNKDTRLHTYKDNKNRVRFIRVRHFKSEAAARKFAAQFEKAEVINNDDGHY